MAELLIKVQLKEFDTTRTDPEEVAESVLRTEYEVNDFEFYDVELQSAEWVQQ